MKVIALLLFVHLASKGTLAVAITVGTTVISMTTSSPKPRPITPPPPPLPPPAPPSALFPPVNSTTPTSMTPVTPTDIVPTVTITSRSPNTPGTKPTVVPTIAMTTMVPTTPSSSYKTPDITPSTPVIDYCKEGNSCQQLCVNVPGGYECQCEEGYMLQRDKQKCQDINECNSIYNDCPVNTLCVNSDGGYDCQCVLGYTKGVNGSCVDVNECGGFGDPCPSNSACENTDGSYICNCNEGYFKDGDSCKNIDYCEMGNDCEQDCNDGINSYTCGCYPGYTLNPDGKTCKDDGVSCSLTCIDGFCVSGLFTDRCECSPGYEVQINNGTYSCIDINECKIPTSIPDLITRKCDGRCKNYDGSYECSCLNGQIQAPDKRTCIDIDECADDALNDCAPPSEGGNCTNLGAPRRYKCSCMAGYKGNGRSCEVLDICSDAPCEGENMVCENYPGSRRCFCEPGYYRTDRGDCVKVEKTFSTVLVMNGPQDTFTDELKDKTSVTYVEMATEIQLSLEEEFQSKYGDAFLRCTVESFESGSIIANVATFFNSEFKGDTAELTTFIQDEAIYCDKGICNIGSVTNIDKPRTLIEDFNECSVAESAGVVLCLPRSTCVNDVGSYKCVCMEGFASVYQQDQQVFCEDVNECEQDPGICKSKVNSFCVNTYGGYECQCEPGFKDIGVCASVCDIAECENGATCIVSNEGEIPQAHCMCPPGYQGEKCNELSHLHNVAIAVGVTFVALTCILSVVVIIMACKNQKGKTYPDDDQYIDEGWDESKGKGHNGKEGGHTNVVMIAENLETDPKYVTVPKEGPNGTALSSFSKPSGSTEVEPTSYF